MHATSIFAAADRGMPEGREPFPARANPRPREYFEESKIVEEIIRRFSLQSTRIRIVGE